MLQKEAGFHDYAETASATVQCHASHRLSVAQVTPEKPNYPTRSGAD